jgi:hypothetical protein
VYVIADVRYNQVKYCSRKYTIGYIANTSNRLRNTQYDYMKVYTRESENRTQMDIERKIYTYDIRTPKNNLFLDISSTNIYIFVPLFYQCYETRVIEVF